ncbi:3-dehydroquinate synthase [Natroniella sulfidigena]|uniref:3-dehydroquinate synthase n=1 Tax=Natroniella sulfidigena TaxID=723921 RepID=UPI00200B9C1A|nr:3-dehydroquinate synthase [Natroniella sulfidigena]MCK8817494.1 3-dehydroquinate synthase [Natroniella sulfidigena]
MEEVKVDLGARSYQIKVGEDLLKDIGAYLTELEIGSKVLIITNDLVDSLYGQEVKDSLLEAGFTVEVAKIGDGEEYKSLETAQQLYDEAVAAGLDRSSSILALGGGVVGDIAGLIAATYMRGINFIQVPTTLLAQVDSSVGGKVAVNHAAGKNLIGAFYQPKLVVADIKVLSTLEERELKAGLAEVIKYGVIWDEEFFTFLEDNYKEILALESQPLQHLIKLSCQIKAAVVAQDETERGLRAILNYGHTLGHALEAVTHYQHYRHGEGVAIGMVGAAKLANRIGWLDESDLIRQERLIENFGLPISFSQWSVDEICQALTKDKKVKDGVIRFILAKEIGEVEIIGDLEENLIKEVTQELKVGDEK